MINESDELFSSRAWSGGFIEDPKLRHEVEQLAANHFGDGESWKDVAKALRWKCSPDIACAPGAEPVTQPALALRIYAHFLEAFSPVTRCDGQMALETLAKLSGLMQKVEPAAEKSLGAKLVPTVIRLRRKVGKHFPKDSTHLETLLSLAKSFAGDTWHVCVEELANRKASKGWLDVCEGHFELAERFWLAAYFQPMKVKDFARIFRRVISLQDLACAQGEIARLAGTSPEDLDLLAQHGCRQAKQDWLLMTLLHHGHSRGQGPSPAAGAFWRLVESMPMHCLQTQAWLIGCAICAGRGEWKDFESRVASRHQIKQPCFKAPSGAIKTIICSIDECIAQGTDAGDQAGWAIAREWALQALKL